MFSIIHHQNIDFKVSKTQLLIFSLAVNIFRLVLGHNKWVQTCSARTSRKLLVSKRKCVIAFWKLSDVRWRPWQRYNVHSAITFSLVYPHTKFQVISFRNCKDTRIFPICKFAMYILWRHRCFIWILNISRTRRDMKKIVSHLIYHFTSSFE